MPLQKRIGVQLVLLLLIVPLIPQFAPDCRVCRFPCPGSGKNIDDQNSRHKQLLPVIPHVKPCSIDPGTRSEDDQQHSDQPQEGDPLRMDKERLRGIESDLPHMYFLSRLCMEIDAHGPGDSRKVQIHIPALRDRADCRFFIQIPQICIRAVRKLQGIVYSR